MTNIKFLMVVLVMSIVSVSKAQNNNLLSANWMIQNEGSLKIHGTTNINSFDFVFEAYTKRDKLSLSAKKLRIGHIIATGILTFPIDNFDCGNAMMNSQMKKTLRSDEFPEMTIQFISLERLPDIYLSEQTLKTVIDIRLAGSLKRYEVLCKYSKDANNIVRMTGVQKVLFSDFGINPPKKLGGLVKAKNELSVRFDFLIKPVGSTYL